VTDLFESYDYAAAKSAVEAFFWRDLADNYLEMCKQRLYDEDDPARLIERAFSTGNAARYLCVKGRTDHICADGKILEAIGSPVIDALEPIGGTGDTITGMVAGLVAHGYAIPEACRIACSANRMAGQMAGVTPATQIDEIISLLPAALDALLQRKAAGI
jgi:NAD(P)H-hydrate repair Nnr-like enzyme with NAD(P)H-hydrate dehydratase domain